ncbi:MAG: hypothetical protein N2Z80_00220 [Hydrogenothermaceae bacterium]|nr:hypothetical protein [Hydrogenothermaceae bacterium]
MSKLLDNTIFEEKSCSINREKSEEDRKKGCTKKSKPGLAAGGCAFDGAQIVPAYRRRSSPC